MIAGLNGKTTCSATRSDNGDWILNKVLNPLNDYVSNGDGTVLFQSSFLSGLLTEQYWAEIPEDQVNTHGGFMDRPNVINGIKEILNDKIPNRDLHRYDDFINKIDWSAESVDRSDKLDSSLDYIERARLRSNTPKSKWNQLSLNVDNDAEKFATTREAALRVMNGVNGDNLKLVAEQIEQEVEFLERHLQTLLLPLLFS